MAVSLVAEPGASCTIVSQIQKMLVQQNITEHTLSQILSNDFNESCLHNLDLTLTPSYGILIGLHQYAVEEARRKHKKPSYILKKLVDNIFPLCTISRADRLE